MTEEPTEVRWARATIAMWGVGVGDLVAVAWPATDPHMQMLFDSGYLVLEGPAVTPRDTV